MQYMVVGADGKEYGPTDLVTLQSWMADHRIMPHTNLRNVQTGQTLTASMVPGLFAPPIAPPKSAFAPPQHLTALPKKRRPILIGCAGFIGFVFIMSLISPKKEETPSNPESTKEFVAPASRKTGQLKTTSTIKKSAEEPPLIASMRKTLEPGGWGALPGSEEDLQACVIDAGVLASSSKLVTGAKAMSLTPAQRRIVERYRNSAISRQVHGYPRLRARFAKLFHDKLWENDIDVQVSGAGNHTVSFTGAVFAANRNIKEFMDGARENLRAMRYAQVRFRWYKGADEYTYYDLKSPRDRDFVPWENGSFGKAE